jgi:hypothetical protein
MNYVGIHKITENLQTNGKEFVGNVMEIDDSKLCIIYS